MKINQELCFPVICLSQWLGFEDDAFCNWSLEKDKALDQKLVSDWERKDLYLWIFFVKDWIV